MCGFITPWNWPVNQIMCKVAPALAAGCTMVLKPTEIAPLNAIIFAEILHEAGVPPGVFNLVNGDGPTVGQAIAAHPDVDMVSFTGSTRAGIQVAQAAAPTVKRVTQELGGKSANIMLDDADFAAAVGGRRARLLPQQRPVLQRADAHAGAGGAASTRPSRSRKATAAAGHRRRSRSPRASRIGPVVSKMQFDKIQGLIQKGIDEGATLVAGGPGRPEGLTRGYYVRPTVFAERDQRHDDRARGDLRARALDPRLPGRGRGGPHRQRHAVRPRRATSRRGASTGRAAWRRGSAPATCT